MRTGLYCITAVMTMLLVSCAQVLSPEEQRGEIRLALSSEVEMEVQTRSGYDDYNIYIKGLKTGQDPYQDELEFSEMLNGYALPYGVYSVEAENCTADEAVEGLGRPRYYGIATDVRVKSPETTDVTVDCRMGNSKVAVTFDEVFLNEFDEASVSVDLNIGGRTKNVLPGSSDQIYFNVEAEGSVLTYIIYGKIDGNPLSYTGTILLRPAKFAHITVKSNHNGILGPGISIQDEVEIGTEAIAGEIDFEDGEEITGGTIEAPVIYVDYEIKDAVDINCILDVVK